MHFLPKIILSNGVEFECSPDQTILDAAKINKIAIEHSCRSGRCGVCLARVLKGDSSVVNEEVSLTLGKSKLGNILTCCRAPLTDVHLDIEDLGDIGDIPVLTLPCRIDSLELLNEDVIHVILRLPPNANFRYIPGQYIDLIHGGVRRSYSIANAPREDGKLELQIKKVERGLMSDYLFNQAKENDLLRLEGPLGTFSYRENSTKNIVLIATGTGIAPIKAILESFNTQEIDKNIFVIWGAKFRKDLYLNLSSLNVEHMFVPVLSREVIIDGFNGYVQDAVLNLELNLNDTTVYACGSELMIKCASKLLINNGLSSKHFYSDAFVSSN